jgi:protein tyrosine phosphatase (PTP) superfamily phosphohydrolase (DUF442 family)
MKPTMLITALISLLHIGLHAQNRAPEVEVETLEDFDNLYRYRDYYIAGQPSLDALKWLQSEGVTGVINLRSEGENEDFRVSSFEEGSIVEELGMKYYCIPILGREGYSPEKLDTMAEMIRNHKKVLIHCAGAGRATSLLMGYLVKYKGYTLDEAVDVGQELTYFLSLEYLLDIEITMHAR